jgi:tetratricopeptide (TPR) repeat protein
MNNLANLLKARGHLEPALALLKNATSIRPEFAAAWMNLGIVYAELGRRDEAEASYLTALQHRPKYPDCYYNLGNLVSRLSSRNTIDYERDDSKNKKKKNSKKKVGATLDIPSARLTLHSTKL